MTHTPRWLVLALGAIAFLIAAKTHGRQLRLERELAGHWHVTFGRSNGAWIDALWRRERIIFWSAVVALFVCASVFRALASRFGWQLPLADGDGRASWSGAILLYVLVPFTGAFIVSGALSLARFTRADHTARIGDTARSATWLASASWGSVAWWVATLALVAIVVGLAWRPAD